MAAEDRLDEPLRELLGGHLSKFERRDQSGREPSLHAAAVAITLVDDDDGRACFVITRRSERLGRHRGQWALPGGRIDRGEDAVAAALRELDEEVGISVAGEDVLGCLDDYPTRSGFLITPVIVWAGAGCAMKPNPEEVAAVYRVPLRELMKPGVPTLRQIPESSRPVISIPMLGTDINAPTAALLFQFREVAMRGLLDARVDHYEQPVFAWK